MGADAYEEVSAMERMLSDEQWALIAPLLPPQKPRGRKRADDRQTLEGIL
jgi:transposase